MDLQCPTSVSGLIDTHLQLWDLDRRSQSWFDDHGMASIRRTPTPEDMRPTVTASISGGHVHSTVAVQCMTEVPETQDLIALAEGEPLIEAVFDRAHLTSPAIGEMLDRLLARPGGSYPRSLRHLAPPYSSAATSSTRRPVGPNASPARHSPDELSEWRRRQVQRPAGHPQVVREVQLSSSARTA
ncbi:hypothetical protein [Streptomyces pseudovenezuelae]|uniref:hypothetical protein n=1 Tax=Streptomyces pseudovenezuelae TaxID=67350 RepID=UPI003723AF21